MSNILRTVDLETTGIDPSENMIVEIAAVDLDCDTDSITKIGPQLINPCRPCPPEASAVHHLTDRHLEGAPFAGDAIPKFIGEALGIRAYVAHRAEFERGFLQHWDDKTSWVCTMKTAYRLWPESPSFSNQTLRYVLGLDLADEDAMPPHRALPDAFVTCQILRRALQVASIDDLIKWSNEPSLLPKVNFGKHRGKKWSEVPPDYIEWCLRQDMDVDVKHTCRHHLKLREAAA